MNESNRAHSPGFRGISIESRYRSDSKSVVDNFYLPILSAAISYSRAVGYFTSASMTLLAEGIHRLVAQDGNIRIIASPHLSPDDIEEINRGYDRRKTIERAILRELADPRDHRHLDGLSVIGTLLASGRLDIKIAFVTGRKSMGIYHEKIGVARDRFGDVIAFTGSANETYGGLVNNFESIEVYRGWISGDGARALRLECDFDDLWNNRTPNLSVEPFPEVARSRIVEIAANHGVTRLEDNIIRLDETDDVRATLLAPPILQPRQYQKDAMIAWLREQGRGILKMATGTGKTKTALFAATQVAKVERERESALVVLIIAPLQALIDQWVEDVKNFGVSPIAVYEDSNVWLPKVQTQLNAAQLGQRSIVVMVATNASFSGARFQSIISRVTLPMMIIGDEAHNLGSSSIRSLLPDATYRMALSATPERWFDDEGTASLIEYFGPVVFELGLAEAITKLNALCPYYYRPRIIELASDENDRYLDLTTKIGMAIASGESVDDAEPESRLGKLLRDRAAVLGHAQGKIAALRNDMLQRRDEWFQLVYCAEGSAPADASGSSLGARQIDQVMSLVGNELQLHAHPYTSKTQRSIRKEVLDRFQTGDDLRVLAAMRCLDEGVDIPNARIGYLLASSSNPRQFVQRRGRLLRKAPGKTHAEIIDYIAVPPNGSSVNFKVERDLLVRELKRVNEFAKISLNYSETLDALRPLKEKYQLMDY